MFFDTHLHIIDKSKLSYPWLAGVPALDADFLYSDYQLQARRCGVDAVLHMEVDVEENAIQQETLLVKALAADPDSLIVGAIASCRPEANSFATYLEQQLADPFVKGFRRVLHVMPDDLSQGALFRENIRRISGSRLTFDLCVLPHQMDKAIELVDSAPSVEFILDHCGVPSIASGAHEPWRLGIEEISRRPNVTCKVSGIIAYTDADSWNVDTLKPYVETVVESFGWDRLIWGSDWPVCNLGGGLSTWVAATHALFAGCSEVERNKVYSMNAKRLWRNEP